MGSHLDAQRLGRQQCHECIIFIGFDLRTLGHCICTYLVYYWHLVKQNYFPIFLENPERR